MMEATKMSDAAKRLFAKQNRTDTLLGIAGWVSLALGLILFSFGLWAHFHSAGDPLIATYRDSTVYVEASYGKEAKIPSDAELRASLVTPENDPDAYMQKMTAAMTAAGRDGEANPTNAIFHIGFYVGDQEVEPAAPVKVFIQVLQDGFAVSEPIKVVHLGENDAKVIAETSVDDDGFVSFTTDGFSDFAFVFPDDDDQDDDQSGGTSGLEGNRVIGNGRSWTGNAMQGGGIEGPGFDGAMTISNGLPIKLNDLEESQVDLTYQYRDGEGDTWKTLPDGKNIFDFYNSDISITFKFTKEFLKADIEEAGRKLTYQLPPYLTDFSASQSGVLLDQNGKEAGTVSVDANGKVTIELSEDFLTKNSTVEELQFTLSGKVDLNKADEKDVGDEKYPGFDLKIPENEEEAHSKYGTLKLEKKCDSSAPTRDKDGNWYVDYTLTVTAPDFDMPAVRVEDVFSLSGSEKLSGLIESYDKYSVEDESRNLVVGKTAPADDPPKDNSVYQINDEHGVPQLNWYLGNMMAGESRTLHYRVKLDKDKMETTDFTKNGTLLPNNAEAFSHIYPKANADADLKIETYVYVEKKTQADEKTKAKFIPDGEGGGYFEYKVMVRNDKNYPVQVKVYDSVDDPNANTTNVKNSEGLSYVEESFEFSPNTTKAGTKPWLEFSEEEDKYTSFTAHLGWLDAGEEITFTYRIHVDAETLATKPVDVNNGIISLLESQEKNEQDTYPHWMERYQQQNRVEQKQWAAKNLGGAVDPVTIIIPESDKVYDVTGGTVTEMKTPPVSFEIGENSFVYTVTVNENTSWDVSSATMGDQLGNGLHYSGYVKVEAKNTDGTVLGTVWVNVDDLKQFRFTGQEIGLDCGVGTSYVLTYYTTIDENIKDFYIVLDNDFTLEGDVVGPDGEQLLHVSVKDSTNERTETSNHLKVWKNAWYYDEPDDTGFGTFYWVVKVDASYIPNGFALRDVAGEKHELKNDSLLGVYTGPEYEFGSAMSWDKFLESVETNGFKEFSKYSSQFVKDKGLTVTFQEYTPGEGQYVYLFFKTYVTERQAEPYKNDIYSNADNISSEMVDHFEAEATSTLPGVGGVEKAGMQVFDWDGNTIKLLGGTANPADYQLNADILKGGNVHAGRYAAWSVSVNKTGTMQGDYTITDQIPKGMELSFVAIAKTVHILQNAENNTPPWAITLEDKGTGTSGLLVGHAKTNVSRYQNGYSEWDIYKTGKWKPWTADNWKYYPSEDGRTVSWGVHIENAAFASLGAYEVDYLVVCRVTDPEVLLGVTKGDPQKTFNNHVTVYDEAGTDVANADAKLTVPCNPVVTKSGTQAKDGDGYLQQTIKFSLTVNEDGTTVEGEGDTLTLEDTMSSNLILDQNSVKFFSDAACMQQLTDGVYFKYVGNVITFTIPNGKAVYIQYECEINAPADTDEVVENTVKFAGRVPSDDDDTWQETVSYHPTGSVTGGKTMQITKKDSLTGDYLSGAKFEVTLLGITKDDGTFEPNRGEPTEYETGENGITNDFKPVEGGLYQIVETKAPDGYVPDSTPKYYWVGKGTFLKPTAEQAGLTGDPVPTINPMYTGVIDVEITNERAKITVKKKFVNADGDVMSDGVMGTYTF